MSNINPRQGSDNGGVVRALPGTAKRAPDPIPQVRDSLDILTAACSRSLQAVIFFGSRLLGTSPNADSAADLIVVVKDYLHFYEDIGSQLPAARHVGIITSLNRVLPPNIIYLNDPGDMRSGAKCFIISERDLKHALSMASRDYFFRGRLSQRVDITYARSEEVRTRLDEYIAMARRRTLDWVPLYLPPTFTVLEYCYRMLEVSYAGEIRPESRARVREVFDAQTSFFRLAYGRVLDDAVTGGKLVREGERYGLVEPVTRRERRHWRWFFRRSKARATVRWVKYMLTFDDWLDYIVRKVERRTGMRVELTPAERKLPFLLLWPKVFRFLRVVRTSRPPEKASVEDNNEATRSS